jgi:hypothetical protein
MEYQVFNHGKSSIVGQMMHSNGVPSFTYFPSPYTIPPLAMPSRNGEYVANDDPSLSRGLNFPTQWLPSSVQADVGVNFSDSRSSVALPSAGSVNGLHEWTSTGSLFGGAGESMENIAQFLAAHYQSQNSDGMNEGETLLDKGKDLESLSASKLREEVGLSLDDSSAPNSALKSLPDVKANLFVNNKPALGKWQDRVPATEVTKSDQSSFSISSDFSHLNTVGNRVENKSTDVQPLSAAKAFATPTDNQSSMNRNSSVENFWMLVRMGDLPRPDQTVLSEVVFDYPKTIQQSTEGIGNSELQGSMVTDYVRAAPTSHNRVKAVDTASNEIQLQPESLALLDSTSSTIKIDEFDSSTNPANEIDSLSQMSKKRSEFPSHNEEEYGFNLDVEHAIAKENIESSAQKKDPD